MGIVSKLLRRTADISRDRSARHFPPATRKGRSSPKLLKARREAIAFYEQFIGPAPLKDPFVQDAEQAIRLADNEVTCSMCGGSIQRGDPVFDLEANGKWENLCYTCYFAKSFLQQGELDEAVAEFKEALKISPNLSEAHHALGALYCLQGRLDDAIVEFQKAIRINPRHGDAHDRLALTYTRQGRLSKAMATLKEGLRICPDAD